MTVRRIAAWCALEAAGIVLAVLIVNWADRNEHTR